MSATSRCSSPSIAQEDLAQAPAHRVEDAVAALLATPGRRIPTPTCPMWHASASRLAAARGGRARQDVGDQGIVAGKRRCTASGAGRSPERGSSSSATISSRSRAASLLGHSRRNSSCEADGRPARRPRRHRRLGPPGRPSSAARARDCSRGSRGKRLRPRPANPLEFPHDRPAVAAEPLGDLPAVVALQPEPGDLAERRVGEPLDQEPSTARRAWR